MRRPTLRSQLNQIRLWLRQGRTEAWIAHKLDIPVAALEQFKREHRLGADEAAPEPRPDAVAGGPDAPVGPGPDGPEAAAPTDAARDEPDEEPETSETDAVVADAEAVAADSDAEAVAVDSDGDAEAVAVDSDADELRDEDGDEEPSEEADRSRRRRRGRRGGRRRRAKRPQYEATFEHGEDGYGLRLDPAVADNPVYAKHWAGQRTVAVTLDPDAITIRRVEGDQEGEQVEEPPD